MLGEQSFAHKISKTTSASVATGGAAAGDGVGGSSSSGKSVGRNGDKDQRNSRDLRLG